MNPKIRTFRSIPLVAAMAGLGTVSALAQTTITGTAGGNDSWNTASNWSAGVPSGAVNAIIAPNVAAKVANAVVPTYTGSLTMGTNSLLQLGFTDNNAANINVLGTVGSTTIYMNTGSVLNLRTSNPSSYSIPAIQLLGNATIKMGESTQGGSGRTFAGGIQGAYRLTLQSNDVGNKVAYLTVANTFGELVADGFWGTGWDIRADAAGSLGGNVTIKAYPVTNVISANLIINAANAMADTATLTLNGPASATKLTMNQSDSVGALVVDGVRQPAGTYGKVGSAAQYQVAWLSGNGILTVLPTPAQYWDLNDTAAGACASGDTAAGTWDAANTFWNATADGTTTSPASWTPGQTAVFAAGTDATGTYTVAVSGTQDIGGLTFEEGNVTLSGDGLRMTSDSFVTVASGSTATIGSAISNDTAHQLTKGDTGTLVLAGTNTYSGPTRIEAGILSAASLTDAGTDGPLGNYPTAGAGGLVLAGGTLQYSGATTSINRGLTLVGNSTVDVSTAGTALALGACATDSTYTLNVTGGAGSSLALGAVTLPDGAGMTFNPTTASLTVASFAANWVYGSGNGTITLGGTASGNAIPGAIAITTAGGNLSVVKSNSSTWTLSGANTYTGNTTVNAGNLIAGRNALNNASGAFGQQNNVDLALGVAGGNVDAGILIGGAYTIGRAIRIKSNNTSDSGTRVLTLGGTTADSSTYSAPIYLGDAGNASRPLTLTAASGGQVTFSGVIQDPTGQDATELAAAAALTAVTKVGAGTVALTAANTYTGSTLVSEGTLTLGNGTASSNLHDLSTVSVASGAVLNLNYTGSDTVFYLNIDGSPAAAGTWGATGSGAANIDDTHFAGTGVINNTNGVLLPGLYAWDGGVDNILTDGNGLSDGGSGTWNATIQNWDRGVTAHAAWGNTTGDSASFGGTAGTVTLDANVNIENLSVSLPAAAGSPYSIGNVGEDNTLTFAGTKTVTVTATGDNTNQDTIIRAGIAGSPTMNIAGRLKNSVDSFSLLPGAGVTQTIGTLNMLNTFASNKRLILGGDSTGNVVDTVTWSVTANQLMLTKAGTGSWTINNNLAFNTGGSRASRLYVEQGTLTLAGTNNFLTHKVGVSTVRESTFTASNQPSKLIAKGTITINDNREFFYVQNLGTISPGSGVATLNVTWNANSSTSAANGAFNMQTGSTYEWDVASNTSTDVINVTTGGSNNGNLILGNMTIKVNDAGVTTPIASTDQLPVFTYETGAQAVVRSIGTVAIETSALGAGWSGTPSLVDNGTGTIYITGLTFNPGGGSAYGTWAATNAPTGEASDDFDNDGVSNAVEFVLGGDKDTNDLGKLPVAATTATDVTFTFQRDQASIAASTILSIEVGTDLANWTTPGSPFAVPDAAAANNPGVTVVKDSPVAGTDTITLTLPKAPDAKKFARLKVAITP